MNLKIHTLELCGTFNLYYSSQSVKKENRDMINVKKNIDSMGASLDVARSPQQ